MYFWQSLVIILPKRKVYSFERYFLFEFNFITILPKLEMTEAQEEEERIQAELKEKCLQNQIEIKEEKPEESGEKPKKKSNQIFNNQL